MSDRSGKEQEHDRSVREGFGDDGGTRVGRPDAPAADDRSMARLSDESVDDAGPRIEGSILDDDGAGEGTGGGRNAQRADGSSTTGRTNDHAQRAQAGMGSEASEGVHGAQQEGSSDVQGGTDEQSGDRSGSEPLAGRKMEHKSGYGGEGGAPRTSSDQREKPDYYGNEGPGGKAK